MQQQLENKLISNFIYFYKIFGNVFNQLGRRENSYRHEYTN